MQITLQTHNQTIAEILETSGTRLDLRCGGHGICGRCRVKLISGKWIENGKEITAQATALACRTTLISTEGIVDIPDALLEHSHGSVLGEWHTAPLPVSQDVTIGIDIGTTTLAAVATVNGKVVASSTQYNPQRLYGDNVISRISNAATHLLDMQNILLEALKGMLNGLPHPRRIAITGNSTMLYIFFGIDPTPLGSYPFILPQNRFDATTAECLGFPDAELYAMPLISAYLGGDTLGGFAECNMVPGDIFIDIGTNCETVLMTQSGTLIGTSAAAGPAFEGGGISCGLHAIPGAICRFNAPNDFQTIADKAPIGICGSGFVDFVASQLKSGKLSSFGRFIPPAQKYDIAPNVFVSEQDIAQFIQAKAALAACIKTIEKQSNTKCRRMLLAGGFATFLNVQNAIAIGLLPDIPFQILGNTALSCAARLAISPDYMDDLLQIQNKITDIPLNTIPSFEDNFIDELRIGR